MNNSIFENIFKIFNVNTIKFIIKIILALKYLFLYIMDYL